MTITRIILVGLLFVTLQAPIFSRINNLEDAKKKIGIDENLGKKIPLGLDFIDEYGNKVLLKKYFNKGKPVIIVPAYYECPNLCTLVLQGVLNAVMKEEKFTPGEEFTILTVSINPNETADLALKKKQAHLDAIKGRPKDEKVKIKKGWHFLTGKQKNIVPLMQAIGFRYKKIENEYAHGAAIMFATADGRLTRYLFGTTFPTKDFRLALLESAEGKIGSFADKVLMFCFQYVSGKKHYSLIAWKVMTIGAIGCAGIFFIFLGFLWFRERKKKN